MVSKEASQSIFLPTRAKEKTRSSDTTPSVAAKPLETAGLMGYSW